MPAARGAASRRSSSPRVAVVIASWCFERLAAAHWSPNAARAASVWFAIGVVSTLVGGQLAFAAGLAPGARRAPGRAARPPARRRRARRAHDADEPRRRRRSSCSRAPPGGSTRPRPRRPSRSPPAPSSPGSSSCSPSPRAASSRSASPRSPGRSASRSRWPSRSPRDERALRAGAVLYAVVLVGGVVLDTPLGGNLVRLAAVFGGPLAAGRALGPAPHRAVGARAAAPLLAVARAGRARCSAARATRRRPPPTTRRCSPSSTGAPPPRARSAPRSRSPPTTGRRASSPLTHPLARGWERQLDVKLNGALLRRAAAHRRRATARWLDALAVRYVALPDVELDPAGAAEGRLVASGRVPGLREVWRSAHWRLYRGRGRRAARDAAGARHRDRARHRRRSRPRGRRRPSCACASRRTGRSTRGRGCVGRARRRLDARATRQRRARPGSRSRSLPARIRATGPRCTADARGPRRS